MSQVLLVVTFRSHQQFSSDPNEDRLPIVKQRIDIADAGKLEQEAGHPGFFTLSLPCQIDLSSAQGAVALNLVNDQIALLIRHIINAIPDAVIIASAGSLITADSGIVADPDVVEETKFDTAMALLGEAQKIMGFDDKGFPHVVLSDWQDWNQRTKEFLNKYDPDCSTREQAAGGASHES